MGIILTYDIAMAAGQDEANRRMRAAGRKKWSRADYNACIDRVNRLAVVFYYANDPEPVGPVELAVACFALQQTRGMSCIRR
jgi:hypothetical protein